MDLEINKYEEIKFHDISFVQSSANKMPYAPQESSKLYNSLRIAMGNGRYAAGVSIGMTVNIPQPLDYIEIDFKIDGDNS